MAESSSRDTRFVTHILARFHNPTSQLERGWVNTNAVSVIDLSRREHLATVLLDDVERGAANPWGVTCSEDGSRLVICHSGTHEISSIDLPELLARLTGLTPTERAAVPQRLSFLTEVRRRIALPGNGPRAVAMAGDVACVAEYYSDQHHGAETRWTSTPMAYLRSASPRRPAASTSENSAT